jgi:antitoxin ParD1/3/4
MSVSVPSEYVPFVNELVASGSYPSQDAVMRDALQLLRERRLQFEELKSEIAIGIDQANRGEVVPFDPDKIIARARKRLVEPREVTTCLR